MSVPAGGPSPLSLRQLEWELHQTWPNDDGLRVLYEHAVSLLRLLRETRAALRPFVTQGAVVYIDSELPDDVVPQFCAQSVGDFRRAAAVLGAAQDGETPQT